MIRRKSLADQSDRKAFYQLLHRLQKIDCDAYEYLLMVASDMRLYHSIKFDLHSDIDACMLWRKTEQGWHYWNNIDTELYNGYQKFRTTS